MNKEQKSLLFKDISARLPHHVKVKIWLNDGTTEEGFLDLEHNYADMLQDAFYYNKIKDIKPYLRPMSSMTEEEKKEYYELCGITEVSHYVFGELVSEYDNYDTVESIDYLNSIHIDYRGLIPKGLALEAPEGMY